LQAISHAYPVRDSGFSTSTFADLHDFAGNREPQALPIW
jgi:hypothetical protein